MLPISDLLAGLARFSPGRRSFVWVDHDRLNRVTAGDYARHTLRWRLVWVDHDRLNRVTAGDYARDTLRWRRVWVDQDRLDRVIAGDTLATSSALRRLSSLSPSCAIAHALRHLVALRGLSRRSTLCQARVTTRLMTVPLSLIDRPELEEESE